MKTGCEHELENAWAGAILFDIDGTLFSSESIIGEIYAVAFTAMRETLGRPARTPSLPEILAQLGKPVGVIFENLAPDLSTHEQEKLSDRILCELVARIDGGAGHHYPGVPQTIGTLASIGYRIFAISNGRRAYVDAVLRASGSSSHFIEAPTLDSLGLQRKSELVRYLLDKYELDRATAFVVGDRASDREAAEDNGCPFIACRYGHGSEDEWSGAIAVLNSVAELVDVASAHTLDT